MYDAMVGNPTSPHTLETVVMVMVRVRVSVRISVRVSVRCNGWQSH